MNKVLKFDSVEAISVGGSYSVDADGKAVRDHAQSTDLESIAKGAPGPAAELNAAAVGVAPAQPAALGGGSTTTTGSPTSKSTAKPAA